jgi:4a-hydroxytetrahydrobiopterin dehydratase
MSSPVLAPETIASRLSAELPRWSVADAHIVRTYRTAGWKGTLMAVNAIAHLAEAAWHHPDLAVSWDKVTVRLQTHDSGGITALDLALARRIEELVLWRPGPEDGGLSGVPDNDPRFAYVKRDA